MRTPLVFIIFNRPETTSRVFHEISKAKPSKLLVVADGPRIGKPEDVFRCKKARAVVENIDWKCDVLKNYSDVNLGCGLRPATGISWVFEHVEEAIILEDDCVPDPSFFKFCDELLARYREDERVMHIAGTNLQGDRVPTSYSYYYSYHNLCCGGWATWRRAWRHFDRGLSLWPELRDSSWLMDLVGDRRAAEYWHDVFERAHREAGMVDYWDYQWTFACWAHSGLSVLPNKTLFANIGYGPDATHTKSAENDKLAGLHSEEMVFPLRHPPYMARNGEADRYLIDHVVLPGIKTQTHVFDGVKNTWRSFVKRHPSMRDPVLFRQRIGQKLDSFRKHLGKVG